MVRTVYVPVLPTTRAARRAYEHVDASVRRRIEPLWTVVPRVGPNDLGGNSDRPGRAVT